MMKHILLQNFFGYVPGHVAARSLPAFSLLLSSPFYRLYPVILVFLSPFTGALVVLAAVVLGVVVVQVWMLLFCKLLLRVVAGEASWDVPDPYHEAFVLSIPSFFF